MVWLAWRQHRLQILSGACLAIPLIVFFLVSGVDMHATFQSIGLQHCLAVNPTACAELQNGFNSRYAGYTSLLPLLLVLPALFGLFWGAPLVAHEVEQGTHRLAWSQSISRTRWLTTKVVVLAAAALGGMALVGIALNWWADVLIPADSRFSTGFFDILGIVPYAYVLFSLALGLAIGTLIRRVIPAMATTLAALALTRAVVELFARPHYMRALAATYAVDAKQDPSALTGAWVISSQTVDHAGRVVGQGQAIDFSLLQPDCPGIAASAPDPTAIDACIHQAGLHVTAMYQPVTRYWLFQGIEAALFTALALALIGVAIWVVRRRVS